MLLSVFFSFAELEDMKMKKTNETGTGESWKNNDFPICKHPSFVRSAGRSVGCSIAHSFVHLPFCVPFHLVVNASVLCVFHTHSLKLTYNFTRS